MAIGFTPKYSQSVALGELTKSEFLVLALEAVNALSWTVEFISENGIIAYTNNEIYHTNAKITIRLAYGGGELKSESTGNEMFDMGKNRITILNFLNKFHELKSDFTSDKCTAQFTQLKPTFAPDNEDILRLPPAKRDFFYDFISVFRISEGYTITPILVNLNLAVFILMAFCGINIFTPQHDDLILFGGNLRPLVLNGDWWRLLTACFLHIGILHLLLNMVALVFVGMMLEPFLGKARFLAAYLLTGIAASTWSMLFHTETISAGASGAIFGMYGIFLALLTTNILDKSIRKPMLISILVFIVSNLITGMKGDIDNAAHVGGLISGIVIGYAFVPSLRKPQDEKLKVMTLTISSVLTVMCCFGIGYGVSIIDKTGFAIDISDNPEVVNQGAINKYQEKMSEFRDIERLALEVYGHESRPKQEILYELRDHSDYYWTEGIRITNEIADLDLSKQIKKRNVNLREYCQLRLKNNALLYKTINENTDAYRPQLEDCDKEIQAKMDVLGVY